MSFEERNDFFVQRNQMLIQMTKEPISVIFAKIKDNDIVTEELEHFPTNDYRTGNNITGVRIPALVFIRDRIEVLLDYTKLFQDYRKQVGTHLFADFEGKVGAIKTYLDDDNRYHVSRALFISEVYPCFTFVGEEYQMCIGLRFTSNLKDGIRSFGRSADRQNPSGGVYDITEDFLDPHRIKGGINSEENRQLFPRGEHHYAIYLCNGSRLIVEDDRYDVLTERANTKMGVHQNRALFQSGSLVIFSAELLLELSIGKNSVSEDKQQVKRVIYEWRDAHKAGIIKPEEGLYQNWFGQRGLDRCDEQVIFLGYNYSLHNSICWRLKIQSPKIKGKPTYARLSAPEGGRIVDIQNWEWGMAEIYWRHRYQRLYEKVLFATKPEKYKQKSHFGYIVPNVGGNNPNYWQKKILGVGVNFNSWTIRHQYSYDYQISPKAPPYSDQYTEMVADVTPFPQPLYPPIYSNSEFKYLPYKCRPVFMADQSVEIDGQKYRIAYKKNIEEHLWKDPKRVSLFENNKPSAEHRIGVDLMVYTKQDSVIGKKILIYFELNPNPDISSEIKKNSSELSVQRPTDSTVIEIPNEDIPIVKQKSTEKSKTK